MSWPKSVRRSGSFDDEACKRKILASAVDKLHQENFFSFLDNFLGISYSVGTEMRFKSGSRSVGVSNGFFSVNDISKKTFFSGWPNHGWQRKIFWMNFLHYSQQPVTSTNLLCCFVKFQLLMLQSKYLFFLIRLRNWFICFTKNVKNTMVWSEWERNVFRDRIQSHCSGWHYQIPLDLRLGSILKIEFEIGNCGIKSCRNQKLYQKLNSKNTKKSPFLLIIVS